MKVLTCSRYFPKGHPKKGQPTFFVESIFNSLYPGIGLDNIADPIRELVNDFALIANVRPKHHTIRAGSRFKPGDMASLRVWSDKPYRSKQIEFAQVEVKKVWPVEIWTGDRMSIGFPDIPGSQMRLLPLCEVAENDGLDCRDFEAWFNIHPKKKRQIFTGQIICWSDSIEYGYPSTLTEKSIS
jgi:hypothetical protein